MQDEKKIHRYRLSEGKHWIEVRVKTAQQLFDSRDPAPFHVRDLDDDFVEYIISAARECPRAIPLKIVIYIDEAEKIELPLDSIRDAIHTFLTYQADRQNGDLKSFMKRAQVFLMIGLAILAICLAISQNIPKLQPPGVFGIFREGIIIFGWVSIWKPLELILYDWYPFYEKLRFYRKLLVSEIQIQFLTK